MLIVFFFRSAVRWLINGIAEFEFVKCSSMEIYHTPYCGSMDLIFFYLFTQKLFTWKVFESFYKHFTAFNIVEVSPFDFVHKFISLIKRKLISRIIFTQCMKAIYTKSLCFASMVRDACNSISEIKFNSTNKICWVYLDKFSLKTMYITHVGYWTQFFFHFESGKNSNFLIILYFFGLTENISFHPIPLSHSLFTSKKNLFSFCNAATNFTRKWL